MAVCKACGAELRRPDGSYCSRACADAYRLAAWRKAYDAALSLREHEAQWRLYGTGNERRTYCPACGDRPHSSDPRKLMAVNMKTGAYRCMSCGFAGLFREHWQAPEDGAGERQPRRQTRRSAPRALPPLPPPPTEDELADAAEARERLRRMWAPTVPIAAPEAAPGAAYLAGRAIPLEAAAAARARYAADWYGRPAVVFPVQGADGRMLAAEGRYTDGGRNPKGRTCGPKSRGVFEASPGALAAEGLTLCEGPLTALAVAACGYPSAAICGHAGAPEWLMRRLAARGGAVFLGFDYDEGGAAELAEGLARELAAFGVRPYRLAPPEGAGDWADYLKAVGLERMRAELTDTVCSALGA